MVAVVGDQNWKTRRSANHNGDGDDDILWRHAGTGATYVWLMNGIAVLSQGLASVVADLEWQIVGSGEYNNDNMADVLWRNRSSGAVLM